MENPASTIFNDTATIYHSGSNPEEFLTPARKEALCNPNISATALGDDNVYSGNSAEFMGKTPVNRCNSGNSSGWRTDYNAAKNSKMMEQIAAARSAATNS